MLVEMPRNIRAQVAFPLFFTMKTPLGNFPEIGLT
jgi:hypothetical protein